MSHISKVVLGSLLALLLAMQGVLVPVASSQPAEAAWSVPGPDAKGVQPLLIILAQPSNQAPIGKDDAAYWRNVAFGPFPSVTDYYWAASYGQLQLVPAQENDGTPSDGVVGWINVGVPHPNTGQSIGDPKNDAFVAAALRAVSASGAVNFAAFDSNHDGVLEPHELRMVVVVAGYEWNQPSPSIWGNAPGCLSPELVLNGVHVSSCSQRAGYVLIGETSAQSWETPHPASLGTVVHELGHNLGLPDLYVLANSGQAGAGEWSVMGVGTENPTGASDVSLPALPDAWSRAYLGWVTPQEVQGSILNAGIPQAETSPVVFQLMPNPGGIDWRFYDHSGTGEYYLVENRQKVGYDAGLPGCGLLIWHIDEAARSDDNAASDPTHPLVSLVQADGLNQLAKGINVGDAGDPFPGSANRRAWGPGSDLPDTLHNGQPSPAGVANVSDCGAMMSADLYSSGMPIPSGPVGDFADVNVSDPLYPYMRELLQTGWTQGCGTDPASGKLLYCPSRPVTRREMALFIFRASGWDKMFSDLPADPQAFADVSPTDEAYRAVAAMRTAGITDGCGSDPASGMLLFCPDRPVTRREMAKFLASQYVSAWAQNAQAFEDVLPSDWGYPYVQALAALGGTDGCGTNPATGGKLYCPNRPVTRAEMAKFVLTTYKR